MRFALRKQEKIKAYFEPHGDEMLNRIKESLTQYFSADRSDFPEGLRDIAGGTIPNHCDKRHREPGTYD